MPRPTKKTDIGIRNTILSRAGDQWAAAMVTISAAHVPLDADGKKIVKAGTFLGTAEAGKSILRDGAYAQPTNGAPTEGLLFNEVDVTHGDREASMLYMGTVGLDRIPDPPNAAVTLPRVTFTQD